MIELTGFSFNAFTAAISLVENLTVSFLKNIFQDESPSSVVSKPTSAGTMLPASSFNYELRI